MQTDANDAACTAAGPQRWNVDRPQRTTTTTDQRTRVRTLIAIPILIAVVAALGFAACGALHLAPHVREMTFAAIACFVAAELALLPIVLARHATQAAVSQASLVGTMIHLFLCTAAAAVLMLTKPWKLNGLSLTGWLMAQYCATLIVLVIGFAGAIKSAPSAPPAAAAKP
jgi:hypothetical protein